MDGHQQEAVRSIDRPSSPVYVYVYMYLAVSRQSVTACRKLLLESSLVSGDYPIFDGFQPYSTSVERLDPFDGRVRARNVCISTSAALSAQPHPVGQDSFHFMARTELTDRASNRPAGTRT